MRRRRFIILVLSLLLTLFYVQGLNVTTVAASPIYQGDLVLTGNNVTTIEGRFDINGSIIVEDNATLHLKNAFLNLTQSQPKQYHIWFKNPSNGNPRLLAYNSTIASDFLFELLLYNSTATIYNSTFMQTYIYSYHYYVLSISNGSYVSHILARDSSVTNAHESTIYVFQSIDSSETQIYDSEIDYLMMNSESVNCTISKLTSGLVSYWSFISNCSVNIQSGGSTPNVTLTNTKVNFWEVGFDGDSNATISNSTIRQVWAYDFSVISLKSLTCYRAGAIDSSMLLIEDSIFTDRLSARDSSNVWLLNSTSPDLRMYDSGKIYVSWYLDVHVEDSIGQDVPSASVTVSYPNSTVVDSKLTDANGWARLPLMEKMVNATGEYPIGDYTVEVTYESYSDETTVNMTETKQVILTLENFVIPEFSSLVLISIFIIATIIVIIVNRRKQQH